ncbi:MAG: Dabb family protein [Clostridia bacterium]|nr:Dabb family protein [Clostridia bacterium]
MVKHIILWKLKDDFSEEEKQNIKLEMKKGLEGLKGKIDGLIDIKVNDVPLESSNADVMLDSTLEDEAALKRYAEDPRHIDVAVNKIRTNIISRVCFDYKV